MFGGGSGFTFQCFLAVTLGMSPCLSVTQTCPILNITHGPHKHVIVLISLHAENLKILGMDVPLKALQSKYYRWF